MSHQHKDDLQISNLMNSSFNEVMNQSGASSPPRKTVYSQYKVQYDPSGFQGWLDLQEGTDKLDHHTYQKSQNQERRSKSQLSRLFILNSSQNRHQVNGLKIDDKVGNHMGITRGEFEVRPDLTSVPKSNRHIKIKHHKHFRQFIDNQNDQSSANQ